MKLQRWREEGDEEAEERSHGRSPWLAARGSWLFVADVVGWWGGGGPVVY